MKFKVKLSSISKRLSEIASVAASAINKNTDDITQNILINATNNQITLKATNYNIELQTVITEDVIIYSEGEITVNAVKLKETLSNLDPNSDITFELNGEEGGILRVSEEKSSFSIRTRSSVDFPSFEIGVPDRTIVLKQSQIKSIIDSCLFCVSNEDFRDYLKGVRLELTGSKLEIFTSDGHRMAILETLLQTASESEGTFGTILTKRCASQLSRIVDENSQTDVTLSFTKDAVQTSCNGYTMVSKIINCGYPNVRTVIPKVIDTQISIPKDLLSAEIRKVSVFSSKRVNGVNFNFSNERVTLCCENSEHDKAISFLELPGLNCNIDISLNAQYVREVLQVIKTENVLFCFSEPMIHVLIKPDNGDKETEIKTSYIISKIVV